MEGRGPDRGRSRLPESLFLSGTLRYPRKTGLSSEVRAKSMMLRKAQMGGLPPKYQPSGCLLCERALTPQIHASKSKDASP